MEAIETNRSQTTETRNLQVVIEQQKQKIQLLENMINSDQQQDFVNEQTKLMAEIQDLKIDINYKDENISSLTDQLIQKELKIHSLEDQVE